MRAGNTHYDVLEVAHTASSEVIQAAYRRLCQKYHPDLNRHDPEAHNEMVRLNAAYAVFDDPHQRRAYDDMLESSAREESGPGPAPSDGDTPKRWGNGAVQAVKLVVGGVLHLAQVVLGVMFWLLIIGVVIGLVKEDKSAHPSKATAEAAPSQPVKPEAGKSTSGSTRPAAQPNDTAAFLQQIADDLNKRAPFAVQEGVYLRRAIAQESQLLITMGFSKVHKEGLNLEVFGAAARKDLAETVCSVKNLRQHFDKGATVVYAFFGNDDRLITQIPIGRGDCEAKSQADGGV